MSSKLKVNNIIPSTGTQVGLGTVGGGVNIVTGTVVTGIVTSSGIDCNGILDVSSTLDVTGSSTLRSDVLISDHIKHHGDTDTALRFPTNDTVSVETGGDERLRIDSGGRLLIGTTSQVHSGTHKVQIASTDANAAITLNRYSNNANAAYIHFTKSRSGTIGGNTIVQSGDLLGRIYFSGNDGSGNQSGAYIESYVDGTPGSTDMPGRLSFLTSADGTPTPVERLRIDSSGRVLIGSTTKAGDSALQVYTADRKHPAIRSHSPNANGYTLLADAYNTDESNVNFGISYSSASLVLGFGCKVSDSADNAFLSSQDSYSTRPCALKIGTEGDLRFYTTETNATTTTDSAVSLTQVFSIDRVGNIRQKISNRYMYFGANQELQVGVVGSDPVIDALAGDLQVKNTGATLFVGRSDHTQFYQNIKMNVGKGIDFTNAADTATGETVASSVLDDYEEGSFTPTYDAPNQSSAGFSHYHNYGRYTKIGDIVTVSIYIQGHCSSNSGGGGNDDIKIVGLPFTPAANVGGSDGRHTANWAIGSRYKLECDDLTAYTYAGNSHIDLLIPSNGGTGTQLKTNQANQNTTQFWGTATYRTG